MCLNVFYLALFGQKRKIFVRLTVYGKKFQWYMFVHHSDHDYDQNDGQTCTTETAHSTITQHIIMRPHPPAWWIIQSH